MTTKRMFIQGRTVPCLAIFENLLKCFGEINCGAKIYLSYRFVWQENNRLFLVFKHWEDYNFELFLLLKGKRGGLHVLEHLPHM